MGPSSSVLGVRSCFEPSACSHVTSLPEYALIRPMIAVSVLSATCLHSLSGLPARMLSIRSLCSCWYGPSAASDALCLYDVSPRIEPAQSDQPFVPTTRSATRLSVPSCWRHWLATRAPLG